MQVNQPHNKAQHTAHFVRWTRASYACTRLCGQRYKAMIRALLFIFILPSAANASSLLANFYILDSKNYNASMSPDQLKNSAILTIDCRSSATQRVGCDSNLTINGKTHINVLHNKNAKICIITESNESNQFKTVLYSDLLNESNPKNYSNGSYVCVFKSYMLGKR